MRLPLAILFCFWFGCVSAFAQVNLVPNPSFEDTLSCPTIPGFDIASAKFWTAYRGSPDFFHPCANNGPFFPGGNPVLGVPLNRGGHQFPIHGDSYGGLFTYQGQNGSNMREFMGVILNMDLTIGNKYFFSCYISNGDSVESNASTNNFGMALSTIPYNTNLGLTMSISNFSIMKFDSIVSEKANWVTLRGSFIADSAYRFLALGNFYNDASTLVDSIANSIPLAYYFVDAVCLTSDSLYNELWTEMPNSDLKAETEIFPNPTQGYFTINNLTRAENFTLKDMTGRILIRKSLGMGINSYNIQHLPAGCYLISIDGKRINKLIKY